MHAPRLRGWLALFAALFVVFSLLNGMALISSAENRSNKLYPLEYRAETIAAIHKVATVETFGRLGALLVGAYVFWLLRRRDRRLPQLFAVYGAIFALFELTVRATYYYMGGFMDEGSSFWYWANTGIRVGMLVLAFVSLLLGFRKAARAPEAGVREVAEPRFATGRADRGSLFWVGCAMVAWPFVMDLFVDPGQFLGSLLVPMAPGAGAALAFAIEIFSVATGLLVLMKLVYRMRLKWIMVLYPVSFGVLAIVYVSMAFLHFTF